MATGRTTTRLKFADSPTPTVSNVTASVPAPAHASVTPVSKNAVDLVLDLPATGSRALTISWDQLPNDASGVLCTATVVIHVKATKPTRIVPFGQGAGFSGAVGGTFRWSFICADTPPVASPLTITMRYRIGRRRPPRPVPPPATAAPNARSPKLTLTLSNTCGTARAKTTHSGGAFVRLGGVSEGNGLAVSIIRSLAGRGSFSAHMLVTFSQPGLKPVRFDVRGYSALGDFGRVGDTKIKRLR